MNTFQLSSESVAAEFRAAMARQQLSTAALAEKLDVTPMWLSRRLRAVTPISVDDAGRIAGALGIDLLTAAP